MDFIFHDKRISGILTIVPAYEATFEQEMANFSFSVAKSRKLALVMGYKKHHIINPASKATSADLCLFGLRHLIDNGQLDTTDISALLFVSQTPDYQMPPTANVIQGKLGLGHDVICLDINQGCAGFEVGLLQAFMLLDQPAVRKVVLLNADVLSKKVSPRDRNSWPLIGDAASVTIVERSQQPATIHMNLQMDGRGAEALMIPAGGARHPHSEVTAEMHEDEAGNWRSADNLVMKGDEVFTFVQREVPPMIAHLMEQASTTPEQVDWFMFHQPNKFMLNKVADAIGVPYSKMPANIVEHYGNSSGVTVPLAITHNLSATLLDHSYSICMAGFGVGLSWGSLIMNLGHLSFCKNIEYND